MAMSAEEMMAQMGVMQLQMKQAQEHATALATEMERMNAAHITLRTESSGAVAELKARVATLLQQ